MYSGVLGPVPERGRVADLARHLRPLDPEQVLEFVLQALAALGRDVPRAAHPPTVAEPGVPGQRGAPGGPAPTMRSPRTRSGRWTRCSPRFAKPARETSGRAGSNSRAATPSRASGPPTTRSSPVCALPARSSRRRSSCTRRTRSGSARARAARIPACTWRPPRSRCARPNATVARSRPPAPTPPPRGCGTCSSAARRAWRSGATWSTRTTPRS